jgi:hypothetical protein
MARQKRYHQQITQRRFTMRRLTITLFVLALLAAVQTRPARAEVNVNISVGVPLPQVVLPAPPEFIYPPALGFYVAVDVPYDIFLVRGTYYLYRDNGWYRARHYSGPWRVVEHRHLPPGLRKHSYDRIRYYRDDEYRSWSHDRKHYKGRYFRPEKDWKERRKWEKERWKEERKRDKDEWRDDRGRGRDEHRDDRHRERGGHDDDHGRGKGGR